MTTLLPPDSSTQLPLDTVPDFHEWLCAAITEAGQSLHEASQTLGFRLGYLGETLRERSWPLPDRFRHIADSFHASLGWLDAWHGQAVAHWESSGRRKWAILTTAGEHSPAMVPCCEPGCDRWIKRSQHVWGRQRCGPCAQAKARVTGGTGRRGFGGKKLEPKNNLARFLVSELHDRGLMPEAFAHAVNGELARMRVLLPDQRLLPAKVHPRFFYSAANKEQWHPRAALLRAMAAVLTATPKVGGSSGEAYIVIDEQTLLEQAGGTREGSEAGELNRWRARAHTLAVNADRSPTGAGAKLVYKSRVRKAYQEAQRLLCRGRAEGDAVIPLIALCEELLTIPDRMSDPNSIATLKTINLDRVPTQDHRDHVGAALAANWESLTEDQRAARVCAIQEACADPDSKARRSLGAYLRYTPKPDEKTRQEWAKRTSERLKRPVRVIQAIWQEEFQERGLIGRASRPVEVGGRCEIHVDLEAAWGRRDRHGYWRWATPRIAGREGVMTDGWTSDDWGRYEHAQRQWLQRHRRDCGLHPH